MKIAQRLLGTILYMLSFMLLFIIGVPIFVVMGGEKSNKLFNKMMAPSIKLMDNED